MPKPEDNGTERRPSSTAERILIARELVVNFGRHRILDHVSLYVNRGEILAIVGASGTGKSTLMRQLAMLQTPNAGTISLFGTDVTHIGERSANRVRRRLGVMFQDGALFGDLSILENVSLPLSEHTELSLHLIEQVAMLKIALAGLEADVAALYPSQLSGGMRKRAAVARGIALDPAVLFLDEPSSGLDPVSADAMDELILELKVILGLTVILVTHDMDSLWRIADRILLLSDTRIVAQGTIEDLVASDNVVARQFFHSRRGRATGAMYD